MNDYMKAQIINMIAITKTFEKSCEMAALKNDGTIDALEQKQLAKISKAANRFISDLGKIK